MIEGVRGFAAPVAEQVRAAQWMAQADIGFALEKRNVDAQHALVFIQGQAKTELINALRNLGQQLRP